MNFGKQFLASLLGSTLALVISGSLLIFIFVGALVGGLASAFEGAGDGSEMDFDFGSDIEDGSVLLLTFDAPLAERGMELPFTIQFGSMEPETQMGLNHFLADMERAAGDDNIEGILIQADMISGYPSMLGEVRDALAQFRASGKWIVAWSEIYTQGAYWMSTVADEVYLHPEGGMDMRGMGMETTFYKRMLEDLGVEMTVVRGPDNTYKSAVEPYLRNDLSEANKEQLMALLEDFWARMGGDIAAARGMTIGELDGHINNLSIRIPSDALELGFVDGLMYEDELHALLLEKGAAEDEDEPSHALLAGYGQYHNPNSFEDLIQELQVELGAGDEDDAEDDEAEDDEDSVANAVAVVYAVGAIQSGEGDDATIGSDRIAGALRDARLDPEVGAVVLRVNSPGGSALASDVIWRETVLLREAGKPLVASMSDLAASGGYYISCAADHILAQPNTITGSIGVFGVLPSAGKLLKERIGLDFDGVKLHDHADAASMHTPIQGQALAAINESVTKIYDSFIGRVADGRGMSIEAVDAVARGRVWTGQDAMEKGLVDGIGNLQDAIEMAAGMANLDEFDMIEYPEPIDPFEQFIAEFTGVAQMSAMAEAAGVPEDAIQAMMEVEAFVNLEAKDRVQARLPFHIRVY